MSADILGSTVSITATVEFDADEDGIAIQNMYTKDGNNIYDLSWMLEPDVKASIVEHLNELAEDRFMGYEEDDRNAA